MRLFPPVDEGWLTAGRYDGMPQNADCWEVCGEKADGWEVLWLEGMEARLTTGGADAVCLTPTRREAEVQPPCAPGLGFHTRRAAPRPGRFTHGAPRTSTNKVHAFQVQRLSVSPLATRLYHSS